MIAVDVAAELKAARREAEYQKLLLQAILRHVGAPAHCKACGAPILWIRHLADAKSVPYNYSGVSHFSECPKHMRGKGEVK